MSEKLTEEKIEEMIKELLQEKEVNVVYPNDNFFNEKDLYQALYGLSLIHI